ncbi:MAG TPA: energy transducer TonB [Chitinophagaceae bacterium]
MRPYYSFLLLLFSCVCVSGFSQIDSLAIFNKVETEAAFPGGEKEWIKYLEKNLNANTPVDNGAPSGKFTVWIQFIVDREGKVSDIKALTHNGYGMEAEVIRIIKKSGAWQPAIQNKRTVKAYRKQPVTFVVSAEDFDINTKVPYTLFANADNEFTIKAGKVKAGDMKVTISRGSVVSKENGKFIARTTGQERVVLTVFNTKKNKLIGEASFEVMPQNEMPAN